MGMTKKEKRQLQQQGDQPPPEWGEEETAPPGSSIFLTSSTLWVLYFVLLHVALTGGGAHLPRASDAALAAYRERFGRDAVDARVQRYRTSVGWVSPVAVAVEEVNATVVKEEEEEVEEEVAPPVCAAPEPAVSWLDDPEVLERATAIVRRRRAASRQQRQEERRRFNLAQILDDYGIGSPDDTDDNDDDDEALSAYAALDAWEEALVVAEEVLADLPSRRAELSAALERLSAASPVPVRWVPFDADVLPSPPRRPRACDPVLVAAEEPLTPARKRRDFLTRPALDAARDYVVDLARAALADLVHDPELAAEVERWIGSELTDAARRHGLTDASALERTRDAVLARATTHDDDVPPRSRLTEAAARALSDAVVRERRDAERRHDYAGIRSGATVVAHRTSPSLKDDVPVFNRVLAALKLRFYGHRPEAALSAGIGLGQCWSFAPRRRGRDDDNADHDVDDEEEGTYATLALNLARNTKVRRVAVEHPANSPSPGTAVKKFRVYGYTEWDAAGYAWDLGSFVYDVNSSARQEFSVAEHVYGNEVPMLKSMRVAIDSNWGSEYSCLYRFLVHDV